jgi:uncharacterized protein YqgV (UPF0045/DUF77 family)
MERVRAEFTVEPFVEDAPGAHVLAAITAARTAGLEPEVGPFATTVEGDRTAVSEVVRDVVDAAFAAGATRVSLTIERA